MAESPIEAEVGEAMPPPNPLPAPEMEPPSEAEPAVPLPQPAGSGVLVNDRFFVDISKPIPELDTPSAKAFTVEDRREIGRPLYALVCTPGLPTRIDAMIELKGFALDGLLTLVEWEVVDWPLLDQRSMVVIYDRPLGGRVLETMEAGTYKVTEYDFPRRIMEPLVEGLKNIAALNIPHREIRPGNVFFKDKDLQLAVLGDCVTVPPGFDQPSLFEPIDRGMAPPSGRGLGGLPEDVYSLGATLVVLMLGYNPVGRISEEEMLAAKMEQGSYAAICSSARLPIALLEPLRGMLNDTLEERWGLEELEGWLSGKKQASIKQIPIVKSEFSYAFEGYNHVTPRTLARYLSRHRDKAMQVINDEALMGWLRRGLDDPGRADGVKAAVDTARLHKDEPEGSDDFVIAKVCMVLDPKAPIRYKGLSFMPDGFGTAMAVELLRKGDVTLPMEVLAQDIPNLWYGLQKSVFPGASTQQIEFAKLKGYFNIKQMGYGFERCLYETNPSLPCQSNILIKDYVYDIEDLLPALDAASKRVDANTKPIDGHIAAFLAAHFEEDLLPHLRALAAPNEETATIGMLSLLAFLQWKLRIKSLLGLSSWVGGLLGPAINTYHSRTTRREIEKEIPGLVRKGSLPELFDLIDNAVNRQTDSDGYIEACREYADAEMEIRDIQGSGTELLTKAERMGKQTAAVISIILSMIVSSVLFISEIF
ncbi:MAG: hypothetical protein HQ512_03980 [Rhodospirillales bacterium]|nr:hypothetical protein [Rhodospirillales bacterium]